MARTLSARADLVTGGGTPGLRFSYDKSGQRVAPSDVVDKVAEFAMISKTQLHVDHTYQRGLSSKRIKDTAANWSWVAAGALKVALRPDGEWFVFDGQHRLAAALLRDDINELPCLVFEMATLKQEAEGFLVQSVAKPISVVDRYKAMIIANDPVALKAQELTTKYNLTIRSGVKPGHRAIGCAGELLHWVRHDPATLSKVFPLLAGFIDRGGMVTDRLLRGMVYLEQRIESGSIGEQRWRKRFFALRPGDIQDSIMKSTALEGGNQGRACAIGILAAINRGLKSRFLVSGINV